MTVVDSSGEATAAALAGAAVEEGSRRPGARIGFRSGAGRCRPGGMRFARSAARVAPRRGAGPFAAGLRTAFLVPGTGRMGAWHLKLNLAPARPASPLAANHRLGTRGPRAGARALAFPGPERRLLPSCALVLGRPAARPSVRRPHSRPVRLADEDVLRAAKYAVGMARGCWPMERWRDGARPEMTFFERA